jgi:hypothetical protein
MQMEITIKLMHDLDAESQAVFEMAKELAPMLELMGLAEMRENVMQKLIADGWESPIVEVELK